MIAGVFKENQQQKIQSFQLSGHAESGPFGQDIVCAAVSALAISTVNGLEAIGKFTPLVEIDEAEGGYLYVELPAELSSEQVNIAQILLENLLLALQNLSDEYSEFIQISVKK